MWLGYSLVLASLLHVVTKSVQISVTTVNQSVKSFREQNASWARNA